MYFSTYLKTIYTNCSTTYIYQNQWRNLVMFVEKGMIKCFFRLHITPPPQKVGFIIDILFQCKNVCRHGARKHIITKYSIIYNDINK